MSTSASPTPEGFARPPRYDAAHARAYVEHVTGLVGDRDPLALMAEAPDRLGAAVAGLSEADAYASIRFAFGEFNSGDDVDVALEKLSQHIESLSAILA